MSRSLSLVLVVLVVVLLCCHISCTQASANKAKLTEKDLRELEEEWMDDEVEGPDDEPFKWRKDEKGNRHPPMPKGKTEMAFVTLIPGFDKKKTEELVGKWMDLLRTTAVGAKGYAIEENKILFVTDEKGYADMNKVKRFVLKQRETEEWEWSQQKARPVKDADGNIVEDSNVEEKEPIDPYEILRRLKAEGKLND